uniref:Si:ch211-8c17.2 n=1 Tax=Sinocyclocheilus grahami TaxID=75366 RepID=A0A672JVM3_SINGR
VLVLISHIHSGHTKATIKPAQHVFRGDTVTLRCDIDGEGVTSWQYSWYKDGSFYSSSELQEHTFGSVTESDAGKYSCYGAERGGSRSLQHSYAVTLTVSERPKPKATIKPAQHVFKGDTVTLRCDIDGEGVTSWQYSWYKDGSFYSSSELQEHTFRSVTESNAGKYFCYGAERGGSHRSQHSYAVTLTVSDISKPTLTVEPQSSLFTGDSVTLRCEVDQLWDGWEFFWSKNSNTESTEASTKTIDAVKVSDGGEYRCRARGGGHYTDYSKPVTMTIYERPKAKVSIKPDQHVFGGDTVTLRCDIDGEGVTSWQYSWYKDSSNSVFSELQEHAFSPFTESDAGKYFCYGAERGGSRTSNISDAVTLTVSGEFDHLFTYTHSLYVIKLLISLFQIEPRQFTAPLQAGHSAGSLQMLHQVRYNVLHVVATQLTGFINWFYMCMYWCQWRTGHLEHQEFSRGPLYNVG